MIYIPLKHEAWLAKKKAMLRANGLAGVSECETGKGRLLPTERDYNVFATLAADVRGLPFSYWPKHINSFRYMI